MNETTSERFEWAQLLLPELKSSDDKLFFNLLPSYFLEKKSFLLLFNVFYIFNFYISQ